MRACHSDSAFAAPCFCEDIISDLEDVSAALAATIVGIINVNGAPMPIAVVQGWPEPNDLQAATNSGKVIIAVYAQPGASSNVTRFQWDTVKQNPAVITTTAILAGGVITFGGTITLPFNVSIVAAKKSYTYAAQPGDTLATIIQQLVYLIQPYFQITFTGTTITFANRPIDLAVYLGGQGTVIRENAREKQMYQITIWASTQPQRVAAVKAFEASLFALNSILLPDGTAGMLFSVRSFNTDAGQTDSFYRRDIIVSIEYGITEVLPAWSIVAAPITVTNS